MLPQVDEGGVAIEKSAGKNIGGLSRLQEIGLSGTPRPIFL
jgi:hypothetical protein